MHIEWDDPTIPDNWRLETDTLITLLKGDRPRYKPTKGRTTVTSVRVPDYLLEALSQYVEKGRDGIIRTKSDAINEAIMQWVWSMTRGGLILDQMTIAKVEAERIAGEMLAQEEVFEQSIDLWDQLARAKDIAGMKAVLANLEAARPEVRGERAQREWDSRLEDMRDSLKIASPE